MNNGGETPDNVLPLVRPPTHARTHAVLLITLLLLLDVWHRTH